MAWRRNGKKQEEQWGGKHTLKGSGTAGEQGGPAPSPRPWLKTSLQVIKPLSLKQENLKCRGRRGAPGSRGLARGGGGCPAVCSLACCVLCVLLCWAFCAACARCPALPSFPFCPSSPLPLGSQPQPPGMHESAGVGAGGACSPVSMVYLCASEQGEVLSAMASRRDARLTDRSALVHHQLSTSRPSACV